MRRQDRDLNILRAAATFRRWKWGYDRARAEHVAILKNERGPDDAPYAITTRREHKAGGVPEASIPATDQI